jgi:hypothetical protein
MIQHHATLLSQQFWTKVETWCSVEFNMFYLVASFELKKAMLK